MKNNYTVDYYFTKKSEKIGEYDKYDVIEKSKIPVQSSNDSLGDKLDIFISKSYFIDVKPTPRDLIFFTKESRFYQSVKIEEDSEFYIINVENYKKRN